MKRPLVLAAVLTAVAAAALVAVRSQNLPAAPQGGPDSTAAAAADSFGAGVTLTPEQRERLEKIATLGYISGAARVPERTGVVTYDRDAAFDGYTLFTSAAGAEARLIDMEGNIVHRWASPGATAWVRVRCFPNGDLIVVTTKPFPAMYPYRMMKLDTRSRVYWRYGRPAHHDFDVTPDGRIYVLVRRAIVRPELRDGEVTLDDVVAVLDPGGTEIGHVSIFDSFGRSERYGTWLDEAELREGPDLFHTNSVEMFERDGRLHALLSLRHVHALVMLDMEREEIVWVKRGSWQMQHEARFVEGGILFFDNVGLGDQSRVIEIDEGTGEILWEYTDEGFYSKGRGAQQRLPNGNTLITESEKGRIIEVTRDGRIVWEYINPAVTARDKSLVLAILRAERLPADFPIDWALGDEAPE